MNRISRMAGVVTLAAAAAFTLAGCQSTNTVASEVAGKLPDLAADGFESFDCGMGVIIDDSFVVPSSPYVAQCWKGAPADPFTFTADKLLTTVTAEVGGIDATAQACDKDVLNETAGIACRAVYVGESGNETLVRIIVAIANLEEVLAKIPADASTIEEVNAALEGAQVEILIGTEPIPEAVPST